MARVVLGTDVPYGKDIWVEVCVGELGLRDTSNCGRRTSGNLGMFMVGRVMLSPERSR